MAFLVGVVALFTVAVFWAAIVQIRSASEAAARPRTREAMDAATRALIDALVGKTEVADVNLGSLTPKMRAAALTELAAGIEGGELVHLRQIAAESGAISEAMAQLFDRRWWERLRGVSLLAALSVGHERQMLLLNDAHPAVRAGVIQWMSRTGLTFEAASRILALLADADCHVRGAGRDALTAAGTSISIILVDALSRQSDPRVVLAALEVAAEMHDIEVAQAAMPLATHSDPDIRAATAGVLAHANDRDALRALLRDPHTDVRLEAIRAAGRAGEPKLTRAVGRCLGDDDWRVRDAAIDSLHRLGAAGQIVLRREAETNRMAVSGR